MSLKYTLYQLYYSVRRYKTQNLRYLLTMASETDNQEIRAVLGRIENIKKKLLALSDEVGQVQSALLKVQNGRPIAGTNFTRSLSTSSTSKRKLIKLDENIADAIDGIALESNLKKSKGDFVSDENGYIQVYTDGACENNGRANAKAGLGVWFGANHPLNISEPVSGRATNNCGEIQACTAAINAARIAGEDKILILTDSQFVINSITKWINGWKKNGWKTADGNPVKNKEDFQLLDEAIRTVEDVKFKHVPGHKGIVGNCAADELARQGAARYRAK